jgi:hypothetical protein
VDQEDDRFCSFVTIEALNLWTIFARSFFYSTALGTADRAGGRVTVAILGVVTRDDALTLAIHATRPWLRNRIGPWRRFEEPIWHRPGDYLGAITALNPSNLATVQAALSYNSRVFNDLPAFRNYYAHKSEETAKEARKLAPAHGLSPLLRPTEIMCSRLPGRPQTLIADFLDDLRAVIELMA